MNDTRYGITQKVPMNEDEMDCLLKLSAALKKQRAPLIRELIAAAYCDLQSALQAAPCRQTHGIASRANRDGPRHGHFASHRRRLVLPNAREVVGTPAPHLRV